jgi:type II secretory pathway component PulJ
MSLVVAILCAGVLIRLFSRRDNRSSGRSRFTLLEVVIAFAILGMVSAGVFSSVLMARRMILAARCHKEADCLAADRAWELYNRDFDFLANYPSPVHETPPEFSVLARFNGVMRSVVYRHLDHCEIEVRVDWEHPTVEGRTSHARFSVLRYRTKR